MTILWIFLLSLLSPCSGNTDWTVNFNNNLQCNNPATCPTVALGYFSSVTSPDTLRQVLTTGDAVLSGGAARMRTAVAETRHHNENFILVHVGDAFFGGNPKSYLTDGEFALAEMNANKVDIALVSNHEFDGGLDAFERLISRSTSTWLTSWKDPNTGGPAFGMSHTAVINRGGLRIGFVGLSKERLCTSPGLIDAMEQGKVVSVDPVQYARELVPRFRREQNLDLVVVLSTIHRWILEVVVQEVPGIDVVVTGEPFLGSDTVAGTPILTNSNENSEQLGLARIAKCSSSPHVQVVSRLLFLDEQLPESPLVDSVPMPAAWSTPLAQPLPSVSGGRTEAGMRASAMGTLVSEALLWSAKQILPPETQFVVALTHAGALEYRNHGTMTTRGDLLHVYPYPHRMCIKEITGAQLVELLQTRWSSLPQLNGKPYPFLEHHVQLISGGLRGGRHKFLNPAGFVYSTVPAEPGYVAEQTHTLASLVAAPPVQITGLQLDDGTPILENTVVTLATNSFLCAGGDTYAVLKSAPSVQLQAPSLVTDVVEAYLQR